MWNSFTMWIRILCKPQLEHFWAYIYATSICIGDAKSAVNFILVALMALGHCTCTSEDLLLNPSSRNISCLYGFHFWTKLRTVSLIHQLSVCTLSFQKVKLKNQSTVGLSNLPFLEFFLSGSRWNTFFQLYGESPHSLKHSSKTFMYPAVISCRIRQRRSHAVDLSRFPANMLTSTPEALSTRLGMSSASLLAPGLMPLIQAVRTSKQLCSHPGLAQPQQHWW